MGLLGLVHLMIWNRENKESNMAKFLMSAAVTVSAYTEVEAETLEEAIEIASDRTCELSFNGCGYEADDCWLIEYADGSPYDITGEKEEEEDENCSDD
jgi:hypothetical protein